MYIGPWQEYRLAQVCKPSIPPQPSFDASSRNELVQALQDFLQDEEEEGARIEPASREQKRAKLKQLLNKISQPSSARSIPPMKPPVPKLARAVPVHRVKGYEASAAVKRVERMKEVYTRAQHESATASTAGSKPEPQETPRLNAVHLADIAALHEAGKDDLEALDTHRSEDGAAEELQARRNGDICLPEHLDPSIVPEGEADCVEIEEEEVDELLKWTQTIDDEIKLLCPEESFEAEAS